MNFSDAMEFRHSCKAFDEHKKIAFEDEKKIIEFGRMSPSSFGFEPWHFLVIHQQSLREKLRSACWNQVQITSASFVVVFLTHQAYHFRSDSDYFRQRLWRRSQDEERFAGMSQRVLNFLADQNTSEWAKRQAYIPLANMMTGAASLAVDSCPIEGFNIEQLKLVLKDYVDWSIYDPAVIAAFGYRLNDKPPRIREPLENIATWIV